jgi:toxin FitB
MPDGVSALIDTSVAVVLLSENGEHHEVTLAATEDHVIGIAGHAAIETCAVLSRMPGESRIDVITVWHMIQASFAARVWLTPSEQESALNTACCAGIEGGALYDAIIGATAAVAGVPLITRDRRALRTYAAVQAEVLLIPNIG